MSNGLEHIQFKHIFLDDLMCPNSNKFNVKSLRDVQSTAGLILNID